jgi:hypothetical protein
MTIPNHIFVCDIGKFLKIRQGSRYEQLLWKVIDVSEQHRERGHMIHNPRKSHPECVSHYYFTSPRAAAKLTRSKYNPESTIVEDYYASRDLLLKELHLPIDSWFEAPIFTPEFEYLEIINKPVRSYEFVSPIVTDHSNGTRCFKILLDEYYPNKRGGGNKNKKSEEVTVA